MRQSLDAARFASSDESIHRKVLSEVMTAIQQSQFRTPPPIIGQEIHRVIKQITQNPDPYAREKRRFNEVMLRQWDHLQQLISTASDPFEMGIRLAIAGNTIDFALGNLNESTVTTAIDSAICQRLNGSLAELRREIEKAKTILYLSDNTGEIVCDRLLIEMLLAPPFEKKVTLCVRGLPIINDATREDADFVGLSAVVPVIDNGNDGLGCNLDICSDEFIQHFQEADLVLAKGLANYETLVENTTAIQPKRIAFLFKSKCPFISHFAGTELGDFVIRIQ